MTLLTLAQTRFISIEVIASKQSASWGSVSMLSTKLLGLLRTDVRDNHFTNVTQSSFLTTKFAIRIPDPSDFDFLVRGEVKL